MPNEPTAAMIPGGDKFRQFARNGRWGTCVSCPRDSELHVYPEFCENTDRHDHHLSVNDLARAHATEANRGQVVCREGLHRLR